MQIRVEPLLSKQRELYDLAMPEPRFSAYLHMMTNGTREAVLPLQALNPMGKPHVAARLDALIAQGAERAAERAARAAEARLADLDEAIRVALVIVDDAAGGWTNRYTTEASLFFEGKYEKLRDWAVVFLWTSETPALDAIERATLASIYRTLHIKRYGLPSTLEAMMQQEGRTAVFASEPIRLSDDAIARARETIERHAQSEHFPVTFACLYGDEAARVMGLAPLGLPPRAGFVVAQVDASIGASPESFVDAIPVG